MLDKCLSDEAVELSKYYKNIVAIYEYDYDNNIPVRDIVLGGNLISQQVAIETMQIMGSPDRWGFSHPVPTS